MNQTSPRAGILTSEFWLNLGAFLTGLFLVVFGAMQGNKEFVEWGVILAAGVAVPYAGVRAFLKSKAPLDVAPLMNMIPALLESPHRLVHPYEPQRERRIRDDASATSTPIICDSFAALVGAPLATDTICTKCGHLRSEHLPQGRSPVA
jgi:hypothetical protein